MLRSAPGKATALIAAVVAVEFGLWLAARAAFGALFDAGPALWLSIASGLLGVWTTVDLVRWLTKEESPTRKAAREYHGQYHGPEDWDDEGNRLMVRAHAAVLAVQKSEVNRRGLLDAVKNDIVLPDQLWDVGRVLHQVSELRRRNAALGAVESDELTAVLQPRREAVRSAADRMKTKVTELELYAAQVRKADVALRAPEVLRDAETDADRYLDLLAAADIAGNTDLIEELRQDSADISAVLSRNVMDALQAGHSLTPLTESNPNPQS